MQRSYLALVALIVGLFSTLAQAQVTLPATGVDVEGYVTVLVTTLGALVATAIGAYFAFFVIKRGLRWVSGLVR